MPRIAFRVQAHPSRAEIAETLARSLRGKVVYDPEPDGTRCSWRSYRECLLAPLGAATHLAIVQDDARPCRGFLPAVRAAVAAQPDRVIALFVQGIPHWHRAAILDACANGRTWTTLANYIFCPTVALVWPARLLPDIVEFDGRMRESGAWPAMPAFGADDEIVGRFLEAWGEWALATVPSLVEHPDEVPSIERRIVARAGADLGRIATCFVDDTDLEAADLDWALPPWP